MSIITICAKARPPPLWICMVCAKSILYWLNTVREDGRPHTAPLVGVWVDRSFVFCTGPTEQKARNLEHHAALTVVTGTNAWQAVDDEVFDSEGVSAYVFRVTPTKVLAFAKSPHGQTRYLF